VFEDPPEAACWWHLGLRSGFEVVYFEAGPSWWRVAGTTTALQEGDAWVVSYELELDDRWRTRSAKIAAKTASGDRQQLVEADWQGNWQVDGVVASHLAGCLDIDLESSAMTNTFPVRRLGLAVGERADSPASYLRVDAASVERLDQTYVRIEDADGCQRYDYGAPAFDFKSRLAYDSGGLVVDYPSIAVRAA
jgi:uncharacterized protein